MKIKGLSAFLPPTRLHAFSVGLIVGFAVAFVSMTLFAVQGCASSPEPRKVQYVRGVDGRLIGCAPGPEVVK